MTIQYIKTKAIIINDTVLEFGQRREVVRSNLAEIYQSDDFKMDLGDETLINRRDTYKNICQSENLLFLNYTDKDFLRDTEVHFCDKVIINTVEFNFTEDIDVVAEKTRRYSSKWKATNG